MWRMVYRRPAWPRRMLWRDLNGFQGNRDFLLGGTRGPIQSRFPLINGWVNDDGLIVTAEIPGVEPDDIDISIIDESLTISGSRDDEELAENSQYVRRERPSGKFSRTIELPFQIDVDAVQAQFQNGLLRIELPRIPEEKPRKIKVN
jgi:HSP20 family protein